MGASLRPRHVVRCSAHQQRGLPRSLLPDRGSPARGSRGDSLAISRSRLRRQRRRISRYDCWVVVQAALKFSFITDEDRRATAEEGALADWSKRLIGFNSRF